jgi:hypothetical protein
MQGGKKHAFTLMVCSFSQSGDSNKNYRDKCFRDCMFADAPGMIAKPERVQQVQRTSAFCAVAPLAEKTLPCPASCGCF